MLPELSNLKKKRQKLGFTQKELANKIRVSQSLIAKIESNKISPSYSIVKNIFESIEKLFSEDEKKVKDIMNENIIFVKHDEKIKEVIKKMKKSDISQFPVIDNGKIVGGINEKEIAIKLNEQSNIKNKKVEEIMGEQFPIINEDMPISSISPLLKFSQAVLVTKKDKVKGIISRIDYINTI